jgi:hypothetical protein
LRASTGQLAGLPPALVITAEADQSSGLDFKQTVLTRHSAVPTCRRVPLVTDLLADWPGGAGDVVDGIGGAGGFDDGSLSAGLPVRPSGTAARCIATGTSGLDVLDTDVHNGAPEWAQGL